MNLSFQKKILGAFDFTSFQNKITLNKNSYKKLWKTENRCWKSKIF